jgi:hypothetical protein
MKFTDDSPRMLKTVTPANVKDGPVFISNHSTYGFNLRHFYWNWQNEQFQASKKGISIEPGSVENMMEAIVDFVNEADIVRNRRFQLISMPVEDFEEG